MLFLGGSSVPGGIPVVRRIFAAQGIPTSFNTKQATDLRNFLGRRRITYIIKNIYRSAK
jgi:hypothetical protein